MERDLRYIWRLILVMRKVILPMMLLLSVLSACTNEKEPTRPPAKKLTDGQPQFMKEGELTFLDAAGNTLTKIDIEIAETPAEQQQGLMNRSFMRNDQGMLFIFDRDEPRSFWMKNTIIPLDIMYVTSGMHIVSIAADAQPFSEASIPSQGPAMYVVEVNSGFAAQYGITPGMKISFAKM